MLSKGMPVRELKCCVLVNSSNYNSSSGYCVPKHTLRAEQSRAEQTCESGLELRVVGT